jgi:hypothetical protein
MSNCSAETGNFTEGRQTQINNRNNQAYLFATTAMTRYSYILGVLIVLLILRNAEILPDVIFGWLFVPVLAYWIIDMLYTFYSFRSRGTFNFDTIVWSFNKSTAPTASTLYGANGAGSSSSARCVDSACCVSGMRWDVGIGKCTII